MNAPNPNYLQACVLADLLAAHGVSRVVISPGSRSTPLARTLYQDPRFTATVLIDERSAGFFALGLAKALRRPVALVCTSGTAAAHYYPAVIEAAHSAVPLVVLTADRPPESRHSGAPQTIDQTTLYGRHARMMIDLRDPQAGREHLEQTVYWTKQALTAALTPPEGPVQINVPMDEPLVPAPLEADLCETLLREFRAQDIQLRLPELAPLDVDQDLLQKISSALCGLMIAGPGAATDPRDAESIHALARTLGWPLLADVASGLRFAGEPVVPFHDVFLRADSLSSLAPDLVLELGGYPTSKSLNHYLNRHRAHTVRLNRDSLARDPDRRATQTLTGDPASWCGSLTSQLQVSRDSLLLEPFSRAAHTVRNGLDALISARFPDSELLIVRDALNALPPNGTLVLASSLPVRYADLIACARGDRPRVFAQRGTNGIDGVISHAAGIAAAGQSPTLLITGDLAFLHDLTGLFAARDCPNLRIMLLNNNGGGIFHFLPVADYSDTFEALHGTPVNVDFAAAASAFGIPWQRTPAAEVSSALTFTGQGAEILEVATDRGRNRAQHDKLMTALLSAL